MQKKQIIQTILWPVIPPLPPYKIPLRSCCYVQVNILLIFKPNIMIKRKTQITSSVHMLNTCQIISIILHCFKNGNSISMLQHMKKNDADVNKPSAQNEIYRYDSNSYRKTSIEDTIQRFPFIPIIEHTTHPWYK